MESQDSSIPSVLTIQEAIFVEPERALDQPQLKMEANRLTMELNTETLLSKKNFQSMINRRRVQVKNLDGMQRGSSVEFFLPSIASSIYTIYENLTGIPGVLGSNLNYWLRAAKIGRTNGRQRTKFNRTSAPHSIRVPATTLSSLFVCF